MDDDRLDSRRSASVGEQFFRLVGIVMVALLGIWLALRVISGILRTVVWLATTALIVAAIFFVFSYLVGKRGEKKGYF